MIMCEICRRCDLSGLLIMTDHDEYPQACTVVETQDERTGMMRLVICIVVKHWSDLQMNGLADVT